MGLHNAGVISYCIVTITSWWFQPIWSKSSIFLLAYLQTSDNNPSQFYTGWWFQPIWKNISQNGFIFPNFRGENKKSLSCHHLENLYPKIVSEVWKPIGKRTTCIAKSKMPLMKITKKSKQLAQPARQVGEHRFYGLVLQATQSHCPHLSGRANRPCNLPYPWRIHGTCILYLHENHKNQLIVGKYTIQGLYAM